MKIINEMYAYIAVDGDGDEGVCAFWSEGSWYPMVGADQERTDALRDMAQSIANETDTTLELRRYSGVEMLETITPDE